MALRPLPVLPGTYLARIMGSFNNLPSTNLFCFETTPPAASGPADAAVANSVSTAIAAHWPAFAAAAMPAAYTANEVSTYPLNSPLEPAQVATMTAAGVGTGQLAPATTAIEIRHTVNRRGKGSQSRTFLTPMQVVDVEADGKTLAPSRQNTIESAFVTFISSVLTDLQAGGGVWLYTQLSKIPPGRTFNITSSVVEPLLTTQRRRARRNG